MFQRVITNGVTAVLLAAAAAGMTACGHDEADAPAPEAAGAPTLALKIASGAYSRAAMNTLDYEDHEVVINSIDLFFYTEPTDDTEGDDVPALFAWHGEGGEYADDYFYVSIPLELIDDGSGNGRLFGPNNEEYCRVYAVINAAETAALTESDPLPTVNELRAKSVSSPAFADRKRLKDLVMFTQEEDGDGIQFNSATNQASGMIGVDVYAAKINFYLNITDELAGIDPSDGNSYQWSPMRGENGMPTAEVYLVNGVQAVRLGDPNEWTPDASTYFDTRNGIDSDLARRLETPTDIRGYSYVIDEPFYTYPNSWEISPLELHRTTMLLKIDWQRADDSDPLGEELTTYYTVPLNLEGNRIEANTYYRVKANINTLGGQNYGDPLELEDCTLEVLDWGRAGLEADIRDIRYLEVEQQVLDRDGEYYTAIMNNTETVEIPFYSSHKTVIKSATIRYMTYETLDQTSGGFLTPQNGTVDAEGKTTTETRSDYFERESLDDLLENDYQGAYIDEMRGTITVHHATRPTIASGDHYVANMNNTEQYTYNSYYITLVLTHADSDELTETITIKQNPPVYIEGEVNASFNRNEDRRNLTYNLCGWVRVNSNSNNPGNSLGGIDPIGKGFFTGLLDFSSSNPVMYIVSLSQLGPGSKFHISDPRSNYNNLNLGGNTELPNAEDLTRYSTWTNAPHIDGGTKTLEHYYPTVEAMTQEDMYAIAPRFRMASSFGKTSSTLTRETARRRCAAYQEYGYPAGRWRLPTLGEMEYVTMLSKLGYIPPLFGGNFLGYSIDGSYWTAQGLYTVNDGGDLEPNNSSSGYVRCVYDDWYWTKEDAQGNQAPDRLTGTAMQTFTWGDKPKNNPQEQPDETAEP